MKQWHLGLQVADKFTNFEIVIHLGLILDEVLEAYIDSFLVVKVLLILPEIGLKKNYMMNINRKSEKGWCKHNSLQQITKGLVASLFNLFRWGEIWEYSESVKYKNGFWDDSKDVSRIACMVDILYHGRYLPCGII